MQDHDGRWLIVRPVDDQRWHLPGGLIEQNAPPTAACGREVREELGLDLTGPLYAVGWNPPKRSGSRSDGHPGAEYVWMPNAQMITPDAVAG
ncbi:NUDIX domain-containing protein [Saccharopolyspora hattusasensis]|uniref:NUDIX domain-containing protein n=1 Tax=Saccharopolyspora hattusasensis TaxID=1128679 RepID=UPI003D97B001